jgi:hypothetical protein
MPSPATPDGDEYDHRESAEKYGVVDGSISNSYRSSTGGGAVSRRYKDPSTFNTE